MIKVVEHLHADIGHGVWFLRDGGGDSALLDPVERFWVGVHCYDNFVGHVVAAHRRFEADKSVNRVLFFADDLCGGVESNARIALDIDHPRDLEVGRAARERPCSRVDDPAYWAGRAC
jgi:hypothetical protein